MFVMEILQEIIIHFMIGTFASFSGHTLSVAVVTNLCLKYQIGDMAFTSEESLLLFLLQGRSFQYEATLSNCH